MSSLHNKIISRAATAKLAALGFVRRGQTRLWLKDHGSWLNVVGFVPSRWSVTVDLDNAAHWVWGGCGFMSLNYSMPRGRFIEFESAEQFEAGMEDIAQSAAERALAIERQFQSFEAIAAYVIEQAQESDRMRPSWFGYYAGVALGILGEMKDAERLLRQVTDHRVIPHADRYLGAIGSTEDFRAKANEIVANQRVDLKLPAVETGPF